MTQFRRLWLDNDELSVDLPFSVDGSTPYGSVRVSVSSVLLWNALAETLARGVAVATGLVLAALLVASVAAGWLLAPVERLRRRLALIEVAEGEAPLELETTADADRIADFFSSISRSVAERDTEGDGDDWVGALLSGLDDGVIVIDGHGRIVSISRSAERLVSGDPDDEVRGRLLHDVLAKDHPLRELVATALLEGASGPQSVSFGYDGTTVECVVTAQTMHRSAGAPGVLVRARDALQMSRLISQLSYSQKLTSLGRLTAGVAHEIKNPLNAIAMQVELAKRRGERGGDGAGELVAPLEAIDTEVRRLDRVVQAFLQFTRPEEVRFEPVDLEGVIAQAASSISGQAAHHGVTVEVSVPEGLPRVQGSAELLRQALVNLMTNACDAMPDGGMLRVAAEHDADGRRVLLHVADTGVGIAEDERERIFELFYTTRRGGNGVGLSMVYRIAELHGGIVGVESAPGEGSRFTMTLPEGPV